MAIFATSAAWMRRVPVTHRGDYEATTSHHDWQTSPLLTQYADARNVPLTIELSDEGLAVQGGSFRAPGDNDIFERLSSYNLSGRYEDS